MVIFVPDAYDTPIRTSLLQLQKLVPMTKRTCESIQNPPRKDGRPWLLKDTIAKISGVHRDATSNTGGMPSIQLMSICCGCGTTEGLTGV
jgi:hypothetical protein